MHIAAFRQLASNKSGVANPSGSLSITATHPIDPLRSCSLPMIHRPVTLRKQASPSRSIQALLIEPWLRSQFDTYLRTSTLNASPARRAFPCDWPYAVRRYNGSGVNSYHYQAIVLGNLLKGYGALMTGAVGATTANHAAQWP